VEATVDYHLESVEACQQVTTEAGLHWGMLGVMAMLAYPQALVADCNQRNPQALVAYHMATQFAGPSQSAGPSPQASVAVQATQFALEEVASLA